MNCDSKDGRIASAAGRRWVATLKLGLFAGASALTIASLAFANPQGGEVVSGQATITTPSATQTTVTQQSDKTVIDWKSFNINAGEATVFVQPNSNSVALNRIFDNDPSIIAGLLSANGKLILINRNGMLFDSGAVVNTAGLIATTADIGNDDFMAGRLNFTIPGSPNAQISNAGLITADEGGVVAFVAPSIRNSGVIAAKLGRVELGAGNTFVLDLYGDNLISFPVSAEIAKQLVDADGKPLASLIDVSGKIEAGSVQLTARAARGLIDNVINVDGEIIASGIMQSGAATLLTGSTASGGAGAYGRAIVIDGGANGVSVGGTLNASGGQGGSIRVTGENVIASGMIAANGTSGQGGSVLIAANNFASLTGSVSANGASGGSIGVTSANNLLTAGAISANGANGAGGSIALTAANRQIATSATQVSANGTTAGGSITVAGGNGDGAGLFSSGRYSATSSSGAGGNVSVGGADIKLIDAKVDASGATAGGNIAIGFTGAGDTRAINADNILVSPTSTFNADATGSGNGGSVVFWSNLATDFMGTITAKGGSLAGNGGFLEVSSKGEVGFWGLGDASAANGLAGLLTLDPKYLIVSSTGSMMPSYELIDPGTGDNSFGTNLAVLANGNTVVTSTGNDTVASNAGAVYVFSTTTGALVSMLTGSRADDAIGSGGITVLSSGNFVVASANWDNGAGALNAGAVTFVNGTTGLAGVVSSSNSLVGSAGNMNVGSGGVIALSNGNYVVASPGWDSGNANVGAVTWGNGLGGTVGAVSAANSLVGSATDDQVGSGGVVALTNGNYVVRSMLWNNVGATDAGAVTWGNGLGGTAGAVSAANSLVGSATSDQVGSNGVTALTNGNYVVASSVWNNGGTTDAGAATWGNGAGGTVGAISVANSLVGATANNNVGSGGVVALSNGNYAVVSQNWDNGGTSNVGAVTWGNGAAGTSGNVGTGNSIVGATSGDTVGSGGVVALTNGNFVIVSPIFDAGTGTQHGAVTWRSGAAASSATVGIANSLVGSNSGDQVGSAGVRALTNGNYVVASPSWNNGGTSDVGAATWGNGLTGITGTISAANSLIGGGDNDLVGSGGIVALTNGNYVVVSPSWDGAGSDRGAATWGNGATGTVGTVGTGNSIVGGTSGDTVANGGVVALTNGNYVVISPNWNNGGDTDTGAVTWASGTGTTALTVSAANSLIGSNDDDNVGSGGVVALSNGNYVVSSPNMDFSCGFFCTDTNAGAVTLGQGGGGTVGELSVINSIIGANDNTGLRYAAGGSNNEILARSTTEGLVLVGLTDPNQLSFARAQALTLTVHPDFLTRTLNTGTAVTLQASNDLTISNNVIANNPGGSGGALTLQAGRSVLINADITTDNGNLTIIANELLAAGVINAQRDSGPAVITMGAGADINAGTGNVRLAILNGGPGKTQFASGDLTLRNVTGGTILAENLGTSAGSDVIIASGALFASGAGTPLVVASQGGNFTNNAGATALQAPNGRWIVYSQTPTANTIGGLAGSPYYNTFYNPANPTGLAATGNRFAYTIAPTLTVTPSNASRPYGDANPAFTYAVTGHIGGDSPAAAATGAPVLSTAATSASSVVGGPYAITASLGSLISDYNYGFAFGQGLLTINPAQLFYSAAPASREYGDPNGVLSGVLGGLKNGEAAGDVASGTLIFTSAADNLSNIGTYAIDGSGLIVTSGNYAATILQDPLNATALTVTPAQLFYLAQSRTSSYGDTDSEVDGSVIGLKNGEDLEIVALGEAIFATSVTTNTGVGQYAILGSGLTVTNGNYAAVVQQDPSNALAYTVTAAQLFYEADAYDREYGDPNEVLTGALTGIVEGEALESVVSGTLVFTTAADQASGVGFYAIDGSGLTVINPNYSLTILQDPGNVTAFEITLAPLTYVADGAAREYGDANPVFTGTVAGLKNSDTLAAVTSGTLTFLSSATPTSNVGDYDINGSGLTVVSGNYALTIEQDSGNETALEVVPAQLFYLANPMSSIYGDEIPPATGTILGLKNGETLESATIGTLVWTADADSSSDVGVYAIEGSGLAAFNPNYEVEVLQAPENEFAMVINPAQLTYVADPKTRIFGFPEPEFTGQAAGLKNGDSLDEVTIGTLVFSTLATADSFGGLYPIYGGGLTVVSGNYLAAIPQDPSNATALTIIPISLTTVQTQQEGEDDQDGVIETAEGSTSSRSNELNLLGVGPVSDDMADGKNDEMAGQLCVLGAPEVAASADCDARKSMGH